MPHQSIKSKYRELEQALRDPAVAADQKKLKAVSREYNEIKEIHNKIQELEKMEKAMEDIAKCQAEETEKELKQLAAEELENLKKKINTLKTEINAALAPANPLDKKNVIMEIRAGAGGDESGLFAAKLFRMYSLYAETLGWKITVLNSHRTGIGGFKEIIFEVKGSNVYRDLKYESGVHRVQRIPETEKSGRVHTSTATVAVLPEAEEIDFKIDPADIRIDVFRSGGHGGQSVNTTDSAVRLTHLPTGTVVTCQDEKSQFKNKEKAFTVLRSRLLSAAEEKKAQELSLERKTQIGTGDRSEKIRTYNFPQDRLTDHRLKKNWHGLKNIMDGNINDVVKSMSAQL